VRKWEKLAAIQRQHVAQARFLGSGYAGPAEARVILRELEKCRFLVTSHRLLVRLSVVIQAFECRAFQPISRRMSERAVFTSDGENRFESIRLANRTREFSIRLL